MGKSSPKQKCTPSPTIAVHDVLDAYAGRVVAQPAQRPQVAVLALWMGARCVQDDEGDSEAM